MLCLRWWKSKVIHGMFKWLGYNYEGFYRALECATLGGGGQLEGEENLGKL